MLAMKGYTMNINAETIEWEQDECVDIHDAATTEWRIYGVCVENNICYDVSATGIYVHGELEEVLDITVVDAETIPREEG